MVAAASSDPGGFRALLVRDARPRPRPGRRRRRRRHGDTKGGGSARAAAAGPAPNGCWGEGGREGGGGRSGARARRPRGRASGTARRSSLAPPEASGPAYSVAHYWLGLRLHPLRAPPRPAPTPRSLTAPRPPLLGSALRGYEPGPSVRPLYAPPPPLRPAASPFPSPRSPAFWRPGVPHPRLDPDPTHEPFPSGAPTASVPCTSPLVAPYSLITGRPLLSDSFFFPPWEKLPRLQH
ncbi:proline-rich protein 2-like [Cricetulus griseus]|uniref:Proline-rich protein 2-like n=1 Tax=Cricetulus griseus TaxID=10029 RepID=A0A9J7K001_CRIGR|nr:proline-rich protein 2-like [Cricetulus griseus]